MSYHEHLRELINTKIDRLESAGEPVVPTWITKEICDEYRDGLAKNQHATFWEYLGSIELRKQTTKCINVRHGDHPSHASQSWLPGFEYLQPYYVVRRGGEEIGVPTPQLTDAEIDVKAALYHKMGTACQAHARDLRRYKAYRKKTA